MNVAMFDIAIIHSHILPFTIFVFSLRFPYFNIFLEKQSKSKTYKLFLIITFFVF